MRNKIIFRRIVLCLIVLMTTVFTLNIFLSSFLKKAVKNEITKEVAVLTKGTYVANIEDFDINLFLLKASARNFSLTPQKDSILSGSDIASLQIENINLNRPSLSLLLGKKTAVPEIDIELSGLRCVFADSLYYVTVGKVKYTPRDSLLLVRNLKYKSFVEKYKFAYHDPKHSDWMDLELGTFRVKNLSITDLLHNKSILADQISLDDIVFRNYKNQKIEIEHHYMPMLYDQIQGIPYLFEIKEVLINNLSVHYQELAKNGVEPGEIFFTKMHIESRDFTNRDTVQTQMNRIDFSGMLMNEGEIKAELYFPVDTAYDHALVKGTLGAMNMISLNRIIEPMAFVRITDGTIQGMDFTIYGGKKRANINMCLLYQDLSVDVLKVDDKHQVHEHFLLSFLADELIKKNNPKAGDPPRRVSAVHERDPLHSSFNYLWKIYFSGVVETLGYTKHLQEDVNWIKGEIKALRAL